MSLKGNVIVWFWILGLIFRNSYLYFYIDSRNILNSVNYNKCFKMSLYGLLINDTGKGNFIIGKSGGHLKQVVKHSISDNRTAWHPVPPGMMPGEEDVPWVVILPKCLP